MMRHARTVLLCHVLLSALTMSCSKKPDILGRWEGTFRTEEEGTSRIALTISKDTRDSLVGEMSFPDRVFGDVPAREVRITKDSLAAMGVAVFTPDRFVLAQMVERGGEFFLEPTEPLPPDTPNVLVVRIEGRAVDDQLNGTLWLAERPYELQLKRKATEKVLEVDQSDLPGFLQYPGAKAVAKWSLATEEASGSVYLFETADPISSVGNWFKRSLAGQGWKEGATMESGEGTMLMYGSPDEKQSTTVMVGSDDGKTTVAVTYGTK